MLVFNLAGGATVTFDSEQNILNSTPADGAVAYATDTNKILHRNGGNWYASNFPSLFQSPTADIGAFNDSSHIGYGIDYISDKRLANCRIGSSNCQTDSTLRVLRGANSAEDRLQIYLNGTYRSILSSVDIILEEDEDPDIRFLDFRFDVSLISGNSKSTSLSGHPTVQNLKTMSGAYQPQEKLDAGDISA